MTNWFPGTHLIQNLDWKIPANPREISDLTSTIIQVCVSAALPLRTLTIKVSSGITYERQDLEPIFLKIVSGCEDSPVHTLVGMLRFEFSFEMDLGRFKLECDLGRVKRLSEGIPEDEYKSLYVPKPPREGGSFTYFCGPVTTTRSKFTCVDRWYLPFQACAAS